MPLSRLSQLRETSEKEIKHLEMFDSCEGVWRKEIKKAKAVGRVHALELA